MALQNTPPPKPSPHTTKNSRQTSNHFYYHYLLRKFSPQPLSLIEALSLHRNHLQWTPSPNSSINAQVDSSPAPQQYDVYYTWYQRVFRHYANENDIRPLLPELILHDKDSCSLWRERDASSSPSHLLRKHLGPDQMDAQSPATAPPAPASLPLEPPQPLRSPPAPPSSSSSA